MDVPAQAMAPPTANRRGSRRLPPRGTVKFECRKGALGLGPNLAVRCLDVSENGLRLVLKAELPRGAEVEVVIVGGVPKPVKRLGLVMRVQPAEAGAYEVGIRLRSPIDYPTLQAVTTPAAAR